MAGSSCAEVKKEKKLKPPPFEEWILFSSTFKNFTFTLERIKVSCVCLLAP
ncbi:hypothetical protein LguiA_011117 [Lonicera macranthoides]